MTGLSSQYAHTPDPRHIAVLVDSFVGRTELYDRSHQDRYRAGVEHILTMVRACLELDVPIVTLGLVAPEQHTPSAEDRAVLLQSVAEVLEQALADLHAWGVAVRLLGDAPLADVWTAEQRQRVTTVTSHNTRLTLTLVLTYDSRADIAQAMQRMRADGISPDQVTEDLVSSYLLTRSVPDPDLIIQTGGSLRLGNCLLWQAAYAEYYAAPVTWRDFDRAALHAAIAAYAGRERRFGAVPATQKH